MMTQSVHLRLPPADAFALFTARISDWWPPESRHLNDPLSTLHLHAGGRFFERASDGRELELGKVLLWEPGQRIVLDFYIATGPDKPTSVDVRFEPDGDGTRVTVTHRPKPESESLWTERAPRYARAWERVLAALGAAQAQVGVRA
jgi:hypothetical protein